MFFGTVGSGTDALVDARVDSGVGGHINLDFVRELANDEREVWSRQAELRKKLRRRLAEKILERDYRAVLKVRGWRPEGASRALNLSDFDRIETQSVFSGENSYADACLATLSPTVLLRLQTLVSELSTSGMKQQELDELLVATLSFLEGSVEAEEDLALFHLLMGSRWTEFREEVVELRDQLGEVKSQVEAQIKPRALSPPKYSPLVAEVHFAPGQSKPVIVFLNCYALPLWRKNEEEIRSHPRVKNDPDFWEFLDELARFDSVLNTRRMVITELLQLQSAFLRSGDLLDLKPLHQTAFTNHLREQLPFGLDRTNVHRAIKRRRIEVRLPDMAPDQPGREVSLEKLCHRSLLGDVVREMARRFPQETDRQRQERLADQFQIRVTCRLIAHHRLIGGPHKAIRCQSRGRPRGARSNQPA